MDLHRFDQRARNPDYTFSIRDLTVRCDDGLQKLWQGLEGETTMEMAARESKLVGGEPDFPPDIDALAEFDPEVTEVNVAIPEAGEVDFKLQTVDEDEVLEVVEEPFQFLDENLAQKKLPYGWNRPGE